MRRLSDAHCTKEKYQEQLLRRGASSIHIILREQRPNGVIKTVRIFIRIIVHDNASKSAIESFLALQKHPGRLDRFPVEIIVRDKKI